MGWGGGEGTGGGVVRKPILPTVKRYAVFDFLLATTLPSRVSVSPVVVVVGGGGGFSSLAKIFGED